MKNRGRPQETGASDYVIRRPLYWPIFLSILFVMTLLLCAWDAPSTESSDLFDVLAAAFHARTGFSIWMPIAVVAFVLLAVNWYGFARFKLVVHEHCFTVTPLLGPTHDVAYSSVEKVTHAKSIGKKGYFIDIEYENKKIHIPYTRNRKGAFKRKGMDVLLKRFERCKTKIAEG